MTKQQIADKMTEIMKSQFSDALTLDQIKRQAIANLRAQ